jgi:chromosome segregation ATPase
VWNDARRGHAFIETEVGRLTGDLERIRKDQESVRGKRDESIEALGGLKTAHKNAEAEWSRLQEAHKTWSAYSTAFLKTMRDIVDRMAITVAEQQQRLEQAKVLDVETLQQHVAGLTRQITTDQRAIEQWERTAAAELRRAGVTDSELDSAFHVVNPDLLKLIVGESLTVKDAGGAVGRIRAVARRIKNGTYADEALEADLSGVGGPDPKATRDPEQLKRQVKLKQQELDRQTALLGTARDQAKARAALEKLRGEYTERRDELANYDTYKLAWANRSELKRQLDGITKDLASAKEEISRLDKQARSLEKDQKRYDEDLVALNGKKSTLAETVRKCRETLGRTGLDRVLAGHGGDEDTEAARPRSLGHFIESLTARLSELTADAQRIEAGQSQFKALQDVIEAKSRQFEMQQRYFSDADDEWSRLVETRDSLHELEQATEKNWDALFTTLGARLNAVVTAVSNIKTAVERINRGLKAYRVSNLRAVQIQVEEGHDTYSAVEALSSQGSLFQDRDALDICKKRLRQMIDANQTIDLESLFELRIRIQETDETWHQAASLDEIGSTGTGMTAKAMIFIQLVRAVAENEQYRLHFYIDGLGELDDRNLEATAAMAVSRGITSITADPRLHLEPLAHRVDELLPRFGKRELVTRQPQFLDRLRRRTSDQHVSRMVDLFDRYRRGLEQEVLLCGDPLTIRSRSTV